MMKFPQILLIFNHPHWNHNLDTMFVPCEVWTTYTISNVQVKVQECKKAF